MFGIIILEKGDEYMELMKKLEILAAAAKYDVSCSSSGSKRQNSPGGIGNTSSSGICHSWSDDGRCISLLKILFTNYCIYDCVYCVNRSSNDIARAAFSPEEVANLTINFYRRNYIEGLFLSSAIIQSPNHTMELLVETVRRLRELHRFNGYIHLKAIPGADSQLISTAGSLVDRMSVNIELPSSQGLKLLAPQKSKEEIIRPMDYIKSRIVQVQEEKKIFKKSPSFVPAGQSTQLIIGATADTDRKIIMLSEGLYKKFNLKRVYYSAFVPIVSNKLLPSLSSPPLLREHRLYQADWLLRFYSFSAEELLSEGNPDFDLQLDPKCNWALNNLHYFPIEINQAPYQLLLRVPGVGVRSAKRIVTARKMAAIDYDSLKKLGVVLKRARYFITCKGKYYGGMAFREDIIRKGLLPNAYNNSSFEQLTLFPQQPELIAPDYTSKITGEL